MRARRIIDRDPRSALTLLEVLLTLALIVVLGSLTWPALGRPLATQRLRYAADDIRTAWGRARISAISSGQTYVFRYTPEGNRYAIECQVAPEASFDAAAEEIVAETAAGMEPGLHAKQEHQLPEGCLFAAGQAVVDTRADTQQAMNAPPADEELTWADPILFYPDGTCSTARLRLVNEHGRLIELSLRGLTGVTTVGPIQSVEAIGGTVQ